MNKALNYDAIVVGSGQGGTPLATALAGRGMKTAIIEQRYVGGTCVNYGCTPTKTMVASARAEYIAGRAHDYGVLAKMDERRVDLQKVRERKREIVASFREGSERRINETDNLSLLRGRASFVKPHTVKVKDNEGREVLVESSRVFINTGTRASVPNLPGLSEVEFLDNESIMELDRVPDHLIIIGGGYIGVEFGQMFRRFGANVTIVQRGAKLLPREDDEISDAVADLFRSEGINIVLNAELVSAARSASPIDAPAQELNLELRENGVRRTVAGSHLLLAAGRTPNTDDFGLADTGIEVDEKGYIKVNDLLETSAPGVWAMGDVKGGPAFTHISYDDYRILLHNVVEGGSKTIKDRLVPYTVFIDPQLGRVGLTEKQARTAGREVRTATIPMTWVARALEIDETVGLMKAVVDGDTDTILGFSMLGIDAGEIAGAVQIAMLGGLPYTALRDGAFAHPTTLESLNTLFSGIKD